MCACVVQHLAACAIAAIAAGYRPVSLAFKWAALADLNNLFTGAVLSGWLAVAAPALVLGAIGVALLRDPVTAFASAFPIVFLLSLVAQICGGNATANAWGIEFVIFADRPYTVAALIRPEDWEALRLLNEWLGPAPMTRDGAIPILELVTEEIVV